MSLIHVLTCVGRHQVTLKCNEVFGCLLYLHDAVDDVVYVLDYVACLEGVSVGLCF